MSAGKVWFIGAGPGDPELITVKGARLIAEADLILYTDSLVSPAIARGAKPGARIEGSAGLTLEQLGEKMIAVARAGGTVARVHTGDPSLFGAVLEQCVLLEQAGVECEIVPGVSSVFAACAALKCELTVPDLAQSVIITRMAGRTPVPAGEELHDFARHGTSIVLYLSAGLIGQVVDELRAGGYPEDTPVAVVQKASWPDQKIVRSTLATVAADIKAAGITMHALIMVGKVFDPRLRTEGDKYKSKLYDPEFSHGYRLADGRKDPRKEQGGRRGPQWSGSPS